MELSIAGIRAEWMNWRKPYHRAQTVHDLSHHRDGEDYVLDPVSETQAYLTGHAENVRPGDLLVLVHKHSVIQYRVEQIEYYSDPPHLWMALVSQL